MPLTLDVIDFFLGVFRKPDEIARLKSQGIHYDQWLEAFSHEPETAARLDATFEAHRDELVIEARKRGIARPWMTPSERRAVEEANREHTES